MTRPVPSLSFRIHNKYNSIKIYISEEKVPPTRHGGRPLGTTTATIAVGLDWVEAVGGRAASAIRANCSVGASAARAEILFSMDDIDAEFHKPA